MLDACLGSHASAAGREQNGSFGVSNGGKQTLVHGVCQRQPSTQVRRSTTHLPSPIRRRSSMATGSGRQIRPAYGMAIEPGRLMRPGTNEGESHWRRTMHRPLPATPLASQ